MWTFMQYANKFCLHFILFMLTATRLHSFFFLWFPCRQISIHNRATVFFFAIEYVHWEAKVEQVVLFVTNQNQLAALIIAPATGELTTVPSQGPRWLNLTENAQKTWRTRCHYKVWRALTFWFTVDMNRAVLYPWLQSESHSQLKYEPLNIYSSSLFHSFSDFGSWDKLSRTDAHGWLSWQINQDVLYCLTFEPNTVVSQNHPPWWGL